MKRIFELPFGIQRHYLLFRRYLFEEEEKNLIQITSRTVLNDNATKSVKKAWEKGSDQYIIFVEDRPVKKYLEYLESLIEVTHDASVVSMKVIDGATFVNMNRQMSSSTFGIYCKNEPVPKLIFHCKSTQRMDLVFDIYEENSLKSQTRENRGEDKNFSTQQHTNP